MRTVEDVLAWLDDMPAADAVRLARLLTDANTTKALAAAADRRVYAMTREMTAAKVAQELDTSLKSVRKAAERERDRLAGRPPR